MSEQIKNLLNEAINFVRSKNFEQAELLCKTIISQNPVVCEAYNLLGLIYSEQKNYSKAISITRKALLCSHNNISYLNNLGKLLFLAKKDEAAVVIFEKIKTINPTNYQAFFHLGKYYNRTNKIDLAKLHLEKVLSLNPEFVPAINNLANIYQREGKQDLAFNLFQKAISINPNYAEIHCNLGQIYSQKKEYDLAESALKKSLQLNPNYIIAHLALGHLYNKLGQFNEAKNFFSNVLNVDNHNIEALLSIADIYRKNGELQESISSYELVLKLEPKNKIALVNLGVVLSINNDYQSAKKHFLNVLSFDSTNPESKFSLAKIYETEKAFLKSKSLYEEVLKGENKFNIQALYELFLLNLRIADWTNYNELLTKLTKETENYISDSTINFNLTPLTLNYIPVPNQLHLEVSKKFANIVESEVLNSKNDCKFSYPTIQSNQKIRIGYLSPDFRLHALGIILKDVFKFHDANKVEIYLYSIVNVTDEYSETFKKSCHTFRDISKLSHVEAAKLINNDQINVLIDLAGYTTHCRPHILALKPAQIQMAFMGYPNTSGSNYIDYIIGDKWLLPDNLKPYYTEKFVHLKNAFITSPLSISKLNQTKVDLGLPQDSFVYCCFNSIYKISPKVFSVWMKILSNTPQSILWLSDENELAVENLKKEAIKYGINSNRLVFAKHLPMEDYLASYKMADVFLDTFYYSAGSTATCALYAGLPILTLAGNTNSSRMGASIVSSANLPSFIVETEDEYINKAIELYNNPILTLQAKEYIITNKTNLDLFDLEQFVKEFERTLFRIIF